MRSTLLLSPTPESKKKKKKKTQVISVSVNPQRPNMVIRPPCYASLTHRYQEGTIFCYWLLIFLIKVQALSNYQYKPFSADILLEKSEAI